jgi:hypothetical protein
VGIVRIVHWIVSLTAPETVPTTFRTDTRRGSVPALPAIRAFMVRLFDNGGPPLDHCPVET